MNTSPNNNQPFLWYVARDLLSRYGEDMSHLKVVFPNKRAQLFLTQHLAHLSGKPVWCPAYTTISDLFHAHSDLTVPDDIKLVCDLYKCFATCTGSHETLDQFYGWGEVLLSDFDDIDKSMADAQGIFSNLRDLHSYDSVDYLSEQQKEVLKHFFKDFDEHHNSKLKERFLHLWSQFGAIYNTFNQYLQQQGFAYEGALFRSVVEDETIDFGPYTYVFVGFNALQEVERQLFKRLQREQKAEFYWDFDIYYMKANDEDKNDAGSQIRKFMLEFPNQLDNDDSEIYDHLRGEKDVVFMGAPTDSVQARYVGQWLQSRDRAASGNRTAVVLCNEGLLPTVIHSIPENVKEVNITTGYPLIQTAAASFVTQLAELAFFGCTNGQKYRQKYVLSILRHPFATYLSARSAELCEYLLTNHRYYPSRNELTLDEGLQLLFCDLSVTDPSGGKPYDRNGIVNRWMLHILRHVAMDAQQSPQNDPLTHESLFRAYTLVNRIQSLIDSGDLKVDPITYQRLLRQVMSSTTIPFHGEPAVGLQVMGVLETRNLDFDHLLVLSCNEGNMPKGIDAPSFIPHSIRSAFGLTTIDHKVGIYAYYFFRMIQRAKDVTILYGNAADNKNTGEKSRFMLQLMVETRNDIKRQALTADQIPTLREHCPLKKSQEVMRRLNEKKYLSPTAINRFLRCPLQFFYNQVAGIKEPDDTTDEIDNRIFGNIFHEASQYIYDELSGVCHTPTDRCEIWKEKGYDITKAQLENVLKDPSIIERCLDRAMAEQLFKIQPGEKLPEFNGLQIINRKVILHYLRQLMEIDKQLAPFTIRGLEGDAFTKIEVTTSQGKRFIKIGGRIDRLDEITDADGQRRIRVVDYKTGSKQATSLDGVEDVFNPQCIKNHSDYYLQAMLYSMIVSRSDIINPHHLPVSPALLFIQHAGKEDYNPILTFGKKKDKVEISDISKYSETFEAKLSELIGHILEPEEDFIPTDDKAVCKTCPYTSICGNVQWQATQLDQEAT